MLEGFDPSESSRLISRWLQFFDLHTYKKSSAISSIAEDHADILYVSSGAVGLYSHVYGNEELIGLILRGECVSFGGRAMDPGRLTVRALRNSNVYIGRSSDLVDLMPDGALNELVVSATTHLFNLLLNQAAAMKVRSLEDRIVMVLKNCARFQGQDLSQEAIELDWGISQVEFANLLGIARPYLNKAIRQMELSGVLVFDGERVVLDECGSKINCR